MAEESSKARQISCVDERSFAEFILKLAEGLRMTGYFETAPSP